MRAIGIAALMACLSSSVVCQEQGDAKVKKLIETANEVVKEVAALRDREFKHEVKKGVHTEKQLREFIKKKLFEEELGGEKLENYQWMLSALGFVPKGMDVAKTIVDVLLSQVGGFYDPDRKAFFMMKKAAEFGESVNRMMIAHELTHALDDQYYDLDPLMKQRAAEHDASFAIGAVIEGSATALMQRWAMQYGMRQFDMRKEIAKVQKREAEQAKVLLSAPPYFSTMVARYMAGMNFLIKGKGQLALMRMDKGVRKTADRAFKNVPVSSEQILHPRKYWDEEHKDLPVKLVDEKAFIAALTKRMQAKLAGTETLGEIHMALLGRAFGKKLNMALMAQSSYWTNRAARGWGGDRLFLLRRGDEGKERGIVWLTWWDTEKDAEEFTKSYRKHYGKRVEFGHARKGRMCVFTYGFAKDHAQQLLDWAREAGRVQKDGQPFELVDG